MPTPPQPAASLRAASIRDIAEQCGVSTSTVSLALRADPRVTAETAARIRAMATALGYAPNLAARNLISKRFNRVEPSRTLILTLPLQFYQARYFSDIFRGILEVVDAHEFSLTVATHLSCERAGSDVEAAVAKVVRQEVDGLIVYGAITEPALLRALRAHPRFGARPIVSLLGTHADCTAVLADERDGAYQAVRHLLELGHRHLLCFVYTLDGLPRNARLAGARQAMTDAGLDASQHLHPVLLPPGWANPSPLQTEGHELSGDQRQARDAFRAQLTAYPQATALLALNDAAALNAWYTLQEAGVRVPDDFSLIGFDDTDPLLDAQGCNRLTSVRVPLVEIGRQAAHRLIDSVLGQAPSPTPLVLPTTLVVRGSTGPGLPDTSCDDC
jgi:DNA-binding LacI/PurR family transcriptional regulator